MRPRSRFPASVAILACAAAPMALLTGCVQPRTACGDPRPGGGPPQIATRDAELCESVRLRVAEHLATMPGLGPERAALLRDMTWRWEDADTLDGLVRRMAEDADPEFAAAVRRAVDEVLAHGTRPPRADCDAPERCLVRGAALGARIALDDAAGVLRMLRRAADGTGPTDERMPSRDQ